MHPGIGSERVSVSAPHCVNFDLATIAAMLETRSSGGASETPSRSCAASRSPSTAPERKQGDTNSAQTPGVENSDQHRCGEKQHHHRIPRSTCTRKLAHRLISNSTTILSLKPSPAEVTQTNYSYTPSATTQASVFTPWHSQSPTHSQPRPRIPGSLCTSRTSCTSPHVLHVAPPPPNQGESLATRHGSSKDPQSYPLSPCSQPRCLSKTTKLITSKNILRS
jgi:hypothetical protein